MLLVTTVRPFSRAVAPMRTSSTSIGRPLARRCARISPAEIANDVGVEEVHKLPLAAQGQTGLMRMALNISIRDSKFEIENIESRISNSV